MYFVSRNYCQDRILVDLSNPMMGSTSQKSLYFIQLRVIYCAHALRVALVYLRVVPAIISPPSVCTCSILPGDTQLTGLG